MNINFCGIAFDYILFQNTEFGLFYGFSTLNTLREEILAGRNFGGCTHPPNPMQFGGIYFGGWRKKLNLAGINFGGLRNFPNLAGINFGECQE